jgi:hypothetical protein
MFGRPRLIQLVAFYWQPLSDPLATPLRWLGDITTASQHALLRLADHGWNRRWWVRGMGDACPNFFRTTKEPLRLE